VPTKDVLKNNTQALARFIEVLSSDQLRIDYWLEPGGEPHTTACTMHAQNLR